MFSRALRFPLLVSPLSSLTPRRGFSPSLCQTKKLYNWPLNFPPEELGDGSVVSYEMNPHKKKIPAYIQVIKDRQNMRELLKVRNEAEKKRASKSHQLARRKVLSGEMKLTTEEIRNLLRLNDLSSLPDKREVLENRLLTFFRRMEPDSILQSNHLELKNLKKNLDDPQKDDDNGERKDQTKARRRGGGKAVEKEKEKEKENEKEMKLLRSSVLESFVADLGYIESATERREAIEKRTLREQWDLIEGAFFAAPSPSSKARCQLCRQPIKKGSVRVSEHYEYKWGKVPEHKWYSAQCRQKHYHASCYLLDKDIATNDILKGITIEQGKEVFLEETQTSNFLDLLRDNIIKDNKRKRKQHERLARAAVEISYPKDIISFGLPPLLDVECETIREGLERRTLTTDNSNFFSENDEEE